MDKQATDIEIGKIYKEKDNVNINMIPGDPKGLPDEFFSFQDTLVFIDEAFLSKLSKYFGKGVYLKFDRVSFAKNIDAPPHIGST